jgi:hypothetical protein
MVLICNNNVLTIDTFHKHRCEEKAAIKDIINNRKYLKEKYDESPVIEHVKPEEDKRFIASVDLIEIKKTSPIYLKK